MSINAKMISKDSITFLYDGESYAISKDHPSFEDVKTALKANDYAGAEALVNIPKKIVKATSGRCTVSDGTVYIDGVEANNVICSRILEFVDNGEDIAPLANFLEKLLSNPSKRCVDRLWLFLEAKGLPVSDDGCFYGYKAVRSDFKDKHTGTMDNSVGKVLSVPRNSVDDNFDQDCSYGLHVGTLEYVQGFANGTTDKILIVKVDPADVVTVPNYDATKLRTCKYEVVGIYKGRMPNTTLGDYFADGDDD